MPDITIVLQDYRIIRQAKLKLKPGIIMTVADNTCGKSTLIKSMKTLLDFDIGNSSNPRHGTEGYAIAMKIDGTKIRVARRGKETFLKFQDEDEVSKLGRGSLSKLEPRFPFKRVDYLDSTFYPNFSFQNNIPLFNDISVFDLFSSMFQDVARVAQRVDGLRKDSINLSRQVQDLEANVGYQTSETSKAEALWKQFQEEYPHLDEDYQKADQSLRLEQQLVQLRQQQQRLSVGLDLPAIQATIAQLDKAQELFPVYDRVQAVTPKVQRYHQLQHALSELSQPIQIDSTLIQKGYKCNELNSELQKTEESLRNIPLTDLIGKVTALKAKLEEMTRVDLDLNAAKEEYQTLFEQIKKEGCPFAVQGVCPKM